MKPPKWFMVFVTIAFLGSGAIIWQDVRDRRACEAALCPINLTAPKYLSGTCVCLPEGPWPKNWASAPAKPEEEAR